MLPAHLQDFGGCLASHAEAKYLWHSPSFSFDEALMAYWQAKWKVCENRNLALLAETLLNLNHLAEAELTLQSTYPETGRMVPLIERKRDDG